MIECRNERGRPVSVSPIVVKPGDAANCTLPYHGRRPADYLAAVLSGDVEYWADVNVNHTKTNVTVYRGVWVDSGLNAGFFWEKHLRFADQSPHSSGDSAADQLRSDNQGVRHP